MKQKDKKKRILSDENYMSNSCAEQSEKQLPNEMNGPKSFLADTPKIIRTPRMPPMV
jgi:hypothetical protein